MPATLELAHQSVDVEAARRRIARHVVTTPLRRSDGLSDRHGCDVHLKLELEQHTKSFKERGALNKLLMLRNGRRSQRRGVVCASAGNHAQGVAFWGARLGYEVTVVMPETTSRVKVSKVRNFGARVKLVHGAFEAARDLAYDLAREEGLQMIHPYDDEDIVAGQGTLAAEVLETLDGLDAIVVPVGGGGLVSGVAAAVKASGKRVAVYGAQTLGRTFAEGLNVERIGAIPQRVVDELGVKMLAVDEAHLRAAMVQHHHHDGLMVEPAGAAGLAAVMMHPHHFSRARVAVVISGGNVDRALFDEVVECKGR
jgi:threonine dehydratase